MVELNFPVSKKTTSLEIFREFLNQLEHLKNVNPETIDTNSHFFTKSESKVLARAEYYIRKELADLKRLMDSQNIQSSVRFSTKDLHDCDAVNIIFSLQKVGLQGSIRYHYDVYRVAEGFYIPQFSMSEKMHFISSLLRE